MLTKLKAEKEMLNYINSTFSQEEQEKLSAYKAYEELAQSYEEQLAQEEEAQGYNPLEQKFLQSLISEVANETLFKQAG